MDDANEFVSVFETGRVYEWDTAKAALDRSGIPCFGQSRTSTGLVEALEHPAPEPGASFALLVPQHLASRAEELIHDAGLSPGTSPDFWHFNSSSGARRWWRVIAAVLLLVSLLVVGRELLGALSG